MPAAAGLQRACGALLGTLNATNENGPYAGRAAFTQGGWENRS